MGLPASGKSTFYERRFSRTHLRINLDMLRTRNRESEIMAACLRTSQSLVIDNTNITRAERARYIDAAKQCRFRVEGYFLHESVDACLLRNEQRADGDRVPRVAILAKKKSLEFPAMQEGFDALSYVRPESGDFCVEDWRHEI